MYNEENIRGRQLSRVQLMWGRLKIIHIFLQHSDAGLGDFEDQHQLEALSGGALRRSSSPHNAALGITGAAGPEGGSQVLGTLHCTIRYSFDKNALVVTVNRCENLPAKDSTAKSSDPYVKLQLLPEKQHKVKTRVMRRTVNPTYDEDFTFYGIHFNQLPVMGPHLLFKAQLHDFHSSRPSPSTLWS